MGNGKSSWVRKSSGYVSVALIATVVLFAQFSTLWPFSVFYCDMGLLDPTPEMTTTLWSFKEELAVGFFITLLILNLSKLLLKRVSSGWPRLITRPSTIILTMLMIYGVFYSYAIVRGKLRQKPFVLNPLNTIVFLSGSRHHPPQLLYCVDPESDISSRISALQTQQIWRAGLYGNYQHSVLTVSQMEEVIDCLDKKGFFNMGQFTGAWTIMDGIMMTVSVYDGTNFARSTGYISGGKAERFRNLHEGLWKIAERAEQENP